MKVRVKHDDDMWRAVPIKGGVRAFIVLVTAVAVAGSGLVVWHHKKSDALASVGAASSQGGYSDATTTTEKVLSALGRHMILPAYKSTPQVAIITDHAALVAEQDFYRGSEDGDALIVFPESREAIIYSPRRDRIVSVGPIRLKTSGLPGAESIKEEKSTKK